MRMKNTVFALVLALALLSVAGQAQTQAPQPATPDAEAEQKARDAAPFMRSFLFTPAEVTLAEQALKGTVTGTGMLNAGKTVQDIPLKRVIKVGGIIWKSGGNWTAWINGRKVTPKALLPEIVDIKVEENAVHLKWFDIGINDIIAITLRPHQTYDIVTGVLLPG